MFYSHALLLSALLVLTVRARPALDASIDESFDEDETPCKTIAFKTSGGRYISCASGNKFKTIPRLKASAVFQVHRSRPRGIAFRGTCGFLSFRDKNSEIKPMQAFDKWEDMELIDNNDGTWSIKSMQWSTYLSTLPKADGFGVKACATNGENEKLVKVCDPKAVS